MIQDLEDLAFLGALILPILEAYECFDYKPLPGYWFGSHFQVVFVRGIVPILKRMTAEAHL